MSTNLEDKIKRLRFEAKHAGAWLQALRCTIALGEHDGSGMDDYCASIHEVASLRRILAMSPEQAWAECELIIRDAAAQDVDGGAS